MCQYLFLSTVLRYTYASQSRRVVFPNSCMPGLLFLWFNSHLLVLLIIFELFLGMLNRLLFF